MATQSTPRTTTTASSLKIKTHVKAGDLNLANHSQPVARLTGLTVKTHIKAGMARDNPDASHIPCRLRQRCPQ